MVRAMSKTKNAKRTDEWINARLEPELKQRIVELAEQNDRTLAAEVRVLLREALEQRELAAVAS